MSLYRLLVVMVASMGLATVAFATDQGSNNQNSNDTQMIQVADSDSSSSATTSSTMEQTKVNINTATTKELMKVKGLTASKAKSIVMYRKKHGDFKSLDDLKQVKGLKNLDDQTMQSIQDQLTTG